MILPVSMSFVMSFIDDLKKIGGKECRHLFPKWKAVSPTNNCEYVYQTASELAVELILEASKVVPECQRKVQ